MDDWQFRHALRERFAQERVEGARWVLLKLQERAHAAPQESPERLENFRALNAFRAQLETLRREAEAELRQRGF